MEDRPILPPIGQEHLPEGQLGSSLAHGPGLHVGPTQGLSFPSRKQWLGLEAWYQGDQKLESTKQYLTIPFVCSWDLLYQIKPQLGCPVWIWVMDLVLKKILGHSGSTRAGCLGHYSSGGRQVPWWDGSLLLPHSGVWLLSADHGFVVLRCFRICDHGDQGLDSKKSAVWILVTHGVTIEVVPLCVWLVARMVCWVRLAGGSLGPWVHPTFDLFIHFQLISRYWNYSYTVCTSFSWLEWFSGFGCSVSGASWSSTLAWASIARVTCGPDSRVLICMGFTSYFWPLPWFMK